MPHLSLALAAALLGIPQQAAPPAAPAIDVVGALEAALIDTIARVEPSVVAIAREKEGKSEETTAVRGRIVPGLPQDREPLTIRFMIPDMVPDLNPNEYNASDYGSGVVIGSKGEILTVYSVVRGASRLLVRAAETGYFDAEVIAADPRSDLAVIAPCDNSTQFRPNVRPLILNDVSKLRPLALGDATKLRRGNFLLALGNPFNSSRDGRAGASWGILANIARRLDAGQLDPTVQRQLRYYPTLLQLDSKLNLGMSGGAVVNLKGELVGLTTDAANAGGFDAQSGYAIPIDALARRAIDLLRVGREVEYGFLGVNLSPDGSNRVLRVNPGTPAGEGGLLTNDAILSIGTIPVTDVDSLVLAVNTFSPGMPIKLHIERDGKQADKTVILSKLAVQGEVIATARPENWRGLRVDFVSTIQRNNRGDNVLEAMARGGVVVSEVQPGSAADDAALKLGQIITAVNGLPIRNPSDFARAIAAKTGAVNLTIEGDQTLTIK